jgi:hypothetical protein
MTKVERAQDAVRALFEHGRGDSLDDWLGDNILRPPTYGKFWYGRPLVRRLLRFAAGSMSDFRYTDEVSGDGLHISRFEAKVGEHRISGVDLTRIDKARRIVQFEIFARPPKAVLALRDAMGVLVKGDAEVAAMMG